MEDARRFKRKEVSFSVLYEVNSPVTVRMYIGKREFDAVASDLSEGGIAILTKYTNYAIPAFTIVNLKFTLLNNAAIIAEDRQRSMEIKGEVRSSLFMKEKAAYRLGISFIDMSDNERNFIANFVKMSSFKTI